MKTKLTNRTRRTKAKVTPDERDFVGLDAWARNLKLKDGRTLSGLIAESLVEKIKRKAS